MYKIQKTQNYIREHLGEKKSYIESQYTKQKKQKPSSSLVEALQGALGILSG